MSVQEKPAMPVAETFYFPDTSIELRFSDLDASGHLNHAAILFYVEQARVRYYSAVLGMEIPRDLKHWVLAEITVAYRTPGYFGDTIDVRLKVPWIRRSSAGWAFTLVRQSDGAIIAQGTGVQVHVDAQTGKAAEIPAEWRRRIMDLEKLDPPA
jgi:acyl-CoA thioester hydrolase